jgi:hypothetical protein
MGHDPFNNYSNDRPTNKEMPDWASFKRDLLHTHLGRATLVMCAGLVALGYAIANDIPPPRFGLGTAVETTVSDPRRPSAAWERHALPSQAGAVNADAQNMYVVMTGLSSAALSVSVITCLVAGCKADATQANTAPTAIPGLRPQR